MLPRPGRDRARPTISLIPASVEDSFPTALCHAYDSVPPFVAPRARPGYSFSAGSQTADDVALEEDEEEDDRDATTVETAIRSFHRVPNWVMMLAEHDGDRLISSLVASVRPKTNSPQAVRKVSAETVINPGPASGRAIRQNAPKRVLPSTREASTPLPAR